MRKIIIFMFCMMTICIEGKVAGKSNTKTEKKLNIAVIYSYKGKGDKANNDSAYVGLIKARNDFGIEFKEFTQKVSVLDGEYQIRAMAKWEKYDLIIGITKETKLSIEKVAPEFPNQKFLVINEKLVKPLNNVATVMFREEEAGFLAGTLAAMMTRTNSVGFIGSTGTDSVKKYERGFRQGAKYIKETLLIPVTYVDKESENPYFDIDAGKKAADTLIKRNRIGVVFHNAGGSGIGVLNAAQENGIFAISSGQEEDKVALGTVLTSIITDLSNPVYQIVKDLKNGNFKGKEYSVGLSEGAIKYTDFPYSRDKVGAENIKRLKDIKEKIIKKEIKVNF